MIIISTKLLFNINQHLLAASERNKQHILESIRYKFKKIMASCYDQVSNYLAYAPLKMHEIITLSTNFV